MYKLKYLSVFTLPITVYISFNSTGVFTFLPIIFVFGVIPLVELFFDPGKSNLDEIEKQKASNDHFYDIVIYLAMPVQLIFLLMFFKSIQQPEITSIVFAGRISALGMMCGVFGINIGHELGHRTKKWEQLIGEVLLLSSLETHFLLYHNRGHHYNVATPGDPATARRGESVYAFWIRSQFGSYIQAWQLESDRWRRKTGRSLSYKNRMIRYTMTQITLLIAIYLVFNLSIMLAFLAAAIIGILLLETVNYIEHYGLLRKQNQEGRYERVMHKHSWNSDHHIGRVMLFELSRHSDHHYKASKKYQLLDSLTDSPQMPTGYPGMMMLSLLTPLWFKLMHEKLDRLNHVV